MAACLSYDANGNLVAIYNGYPQVMGYNYDDENRLTGITYNDPGQPTSAWWQTVFKYDGLGRLRERDEYTWLDGYGWYPNSTTDYIYDGMRVIQERGNSTVSYTRGTDLSGTLERAGGIGGLLARSSGSTHLYYHAEGNGNITYLVNSSQGLAASYRYDPFGNTISWSGTFASANVYRFSSKELHLNSGMYYFGYRFYGPNLQRWPNRDPLGEAGVRIIGRPVRGPRRLAELIEGPNLYTFVANGPLAYVDTDGMGKYKLPPEGPVRLPPPVTKPFPRPSWPTKLWKCVAAPINAVTCTSCAGGLLGIEAICGGAYGGWKGQGYSSYNDCLCDQYNNNWLLKTTCNSCFSLPIALPGLGDLFSAIAGCGEGN